MTGFTLNWFLKDRNGSQLTEKLPPRQEDWKQEVPNPKYKEPLLAEMVQLAMQFNMTNENVLEELYHKKVKIIENLEEDGVCSNERVKPENQKEPFSKLVSYDSTNKNEGPPSDEDIRTGYKLFHAVVYCPPARVIKLFRFVDQLLSRESSRTIIQTFVNLFQTGNKTDFAILSLAKQFYHVLASTLDLQYGNVLLATSSKAQLQAAIRNDQPFFVNNSDQLEKCLKESQCDELQNKLQTLGIVLSKASHIFCNASLFQMATEFHKSCLSTQST